MSEKPSFFAELKRRNVYKVAVAYAVIAWLLIQAASILFPTYEAPPWVMKVFVAVVVLGFPVALTLAWAFELTPEGIKRAEDVNPGESITRKTGRKLVGITVALAVIAAGLFAYQWLRPKSTLTLRQSEAAPGSTTASPPIPEKSIAVLPFENFSDDKQNAFFADGVQDEILTDLAKIADLKVISRTSVMQYKDTAKRNLPEIAQALKVAHVLEGSVQRASNRVRVNAQLIDARTDAHLWAQRYDGDLADVFAIQAEIAQKIADQLQAVLSPKEQAAIAAKPTKDLDAYDLYLRAKEIAQSSTTFLRQPLQEEIRLLDQAVARDPAFVPALCLLARAHLQIYWFNFDHTEARLDQAKKAIDAAARLQPDAGEVHLARAVFYYWGSRDYAPALAELSLARRSLPNDAEIPFFTGLIERRQGQLEDATRHLEEALNLDPQNAQTIAELSTTYGVCRRYSDSARVLDAGLRWKPNDFGFQLYRAGVDRDRSADLRRWEEMLSGDAARAADADTVAANRMLVALEQRNFREAEKALAACNQTDINNPVGNFPREMYAGVVARGLGDPAKAHTSFLAARERASLAATRQAGDAKALIILALIDAYLGRKEDAVREGEHAAEMLPVTKDALDGTAILVYLASIYAQVGPLGRALDLLDQGAHLPNGPSYGELKLGLDWDPLRADPRFEKIVASLAPKDTGN
jgi:TolB-like protein/Flp pilus assembly protein TadD